MNRPLIVNPEAEADLVDARDWYGGRGAGHGDAFLRGVEETFTRIRRTPELYGKVFGDLRLTRVRRFPYVVIDRLDEAQVTVVAVYLTCRSPRGCQDRG